MRNCRNFNVGFVFYGIFIRKFFILLEEVELNVFLFIIIYRKEFFY